VFDEGRGGGRKRRSVGALVPFVQYRSFGRVQQQEPVIKKETGTAAALLPPPTSNAPFPSRLFSAAPSPLKRLCPQAAINRS
jgi:hypothetical protein